MAVRLFAHSVRGLRIGGLSQSALGALNAVLERVPFSIVEFLLPSLCLTKELECSLVLLVVEVVEAVPQHVASPTRGTHSVE
jgi:hypothetical protein